MARTIDGMNARKFGSARHRFGLPAGRWWGGSTRRGKIVYLHILRWPTDTVVLPDIGARIVRHTVLTGGEATVRQTDAGTEVSVPADRRDALDTIVKLEFDRDVGNARALSTGPRSLAEGCKATASGV